MSAAGSSHFIIVMRDLVHERLEHLPTQGQLDQLTVGEHRVVHITEAKYASWFLAGTNRGMSLVDAVCKGASEPTHIRIGCKLARTVVVVHLEVASQLQVDALYQAFDAAISSTPATRQGEQHGPACSSVSADRTGQLAPGRTGPRAPGEHD
jgi:hypothetical protein